MKSKFQITNWFTFSCIHLCQRSHCFTCFFCGDCNAPFPCCCRVYYM